MILISLISILIIFCIYLRPNGIHCGDKFTMLLATGPSPVKSLHTTGSSADIGGVADAIAADRPADATAAHYFTEVESLLKESVPVDVSETGGKAGDPWPKFSAKALNFQSLDSTQMMGILLLLMAKACMFESGVPLESPLTAAAGAGGGDFNDVVSTFLKSTKSRSGGLALYKASNPQLLGLDRAYAVECADSTFTNLLSLLDSLFARYNDNLSRFVAKSTSETVSDQLSALTIEATVGAGAQGPIVGTAMDASAAATAAEGAIVPPIASAGISVETSELNAQLLVGQFEPLFCALIVFAANIEVFADRCRELHKQRSTAVDGFRVRAKDWRNIQRELGRMAHISLEEKVEDSDGKETDRSDESRLRRRHLSNFDHETEGDEEQAADHGDGDAEYSLGSIESEERRLLQSIARQQQQYHQHHEEYDIDTAEQRQQQHHHHHHRHQQDQQSDDDDDGGGRDYRDEKSSFEGDQDFGADSGDDSFFSGDRSRRRGTGMDESFDHEDDQSRDERSTRPYDTGEYGPRSAVNDAAALAGQVAHLPGAAVTGSSARLRLPADNVTAGEDSQESSVGGDRERGEGAPYLSRGDSPAQSFDSLGYPLDHGDGYDNGPHYVEDEYLSGSGSDSQDSRFDGRRTNQTGNADDDEDMEKYYEEQAQEMENLDLQRAIISSMQEGASPVVFESNVYRNCLMQLDGKPGRFGEGIGLSTPGSAPVIPLIRDVVNSMASKCYLALEALCASAVEDSTVAGKRNNPAALVGSVSEGSGDSSSGGAVESVYLLWEAAQVVTTIGFDALYSEHDQRTVLAQLIRLPSSFLYIVPGIVDGATKENKLHALISSVMLPNEAIFSGTLSSSVAERTENTVDLPSVVSFLEFINSHIRACRDVPVAGAAQLSGSAGGRQNTATVAEHYSVKMFARITSALLELMKSLLQVVFDRVASSNPILNESLGFLPEQPLGPVVAKLFDLVTEIVSSDLEVLTTKLSAFDVSPEGRFHASFTSTVVAFTYSRAMKDFGAIPAAALLPNSIKLLRIFQANYNAYKKFLPEDRDAFNAWLVASFQWVVYHLSGTVNLLLVPPQAISPPTIRKTLLACRALFSAGDVRKYSNGASVAAVHSSLYTWEQQVWSMLSRADVHTISRANSTLSKESSVMSETPLDRVDVTSGVDAALLVAASFVMTAFPIIGTSQSTLWSSGGESIYGTSATTHSKFLSAAIADLSKAFTADKLSQYLKQMHCGDLPTWQNFSIAAQGFLALLHTLCRSQNIPLAALAGLIETLESDSKKNESGRLAAVQGLLNSSTDMISFVSVVLHSFALFLSMLEHIATSGHIANKTAALRALVVTCKSLLGSGYHVLVSCALPLTIVKEALFESLNSSAALTGKLEGLVRSHFSPLRAAMLCALEGNQVHLDARAHLDLTLKPFDKDVHSNSTTASVEATAMLAVSLLCNNLPLSHLAQLCMWEEDCLRNKQFALSLLVFLVESLHLCPEAMRYCAESLQSFVDPLETLEEIAYVLKQQAGDRAGGAALNSNIVGPASGAIKNPGGSAALSLGLKAEQMLVKLDSYLSSKIGSLPTTTASSPPLKAATKSSFGEPSLKQIPDLLTLVRYSLVAQAQFSEQSSAPAVTMTPFTGSLKKASEAIAFLLRARKPEDHSGLSLTDTLAANKYLHLLQSSLAGLTSLQTIDSQQRLIYNVKATQGDKAHERSAFLHALCGVLSPLGGLMKVLVTSFQQHLIFCQAVGAQFLFPSIKPIEHTSPTILANVFTPQGNYTLGFWLYIPPRSVLFSAAVATDSKAHQTSAVRIHLLSRMYECGDVNLIALLDRNPTNAAPCFSLTVHLVVDPSASSAESGMHLEIIIAATDYTTMSRESLNTSANTRTKAVRTMCVKSKPLRASEWISCVIELVQDSVALPRDTSREIAMGAAARALARKNYKTKYQDTTCAALFVNGEMQAAAAMTGGRTALHQNMVLGKIPTKLGISSNEKDQIILTDVFWIPTSIYLASANSGYQKIRNFLSKLASEDRIFQFKKEDLASVEVSARDDFYQNLLPRCPPSLLLETLNNSFHCSSRLLELITSNITTTAAANAIGASNGKADKTIEQALPLNLVPVLCAFSTDIISTGDPRCQEAAIKMLCGIIEVLPPTLALCDGGELEVAKAAIMASSSPAGSAFNAAVQNKTVSLLRQAIAHCFSLMEDFTRSSFSDGYTSVIGPDAFDLSFLKESPYVQSATSNKDIWRKRLKFARLSVERCLRISEWGAHISIDENLLITGFAALLAAVVRKRLVDAQFQSECGVFANILSAGGWSPLVSVGRTAQLAPRRLFLHFDQRTFEQCAFPSTAVVMGANAARPGLWLSHCDGTYQRIDQLSYFNPLLPRSQRSASLATEMVSAQDSFMVLSLGQLGDTLNKLPLRSAEELMVMLKNLVAQPSAKVKAAVVKTKSLHTRSLANQFENALSPGANTPGVDSLAEKLQNEAIASADQSYLELMQEISYLRCLAVQLTHLTQSNLISGGNPDEAQVHQLKLLRATVAGNMGKILSIAVQDPVQAVSAIFSSGAFKGVQLDVLKNLIKEGDISFLEKITLRLWKQYKSDVNPACESGYGTTSTSAALIQLTSLAGEVAISDTKIRALSQFPSVRLLGVALERMTGRWFYECTMLTDGLVQLGWANALFRCEPTSGQGVGDHTHSWAYDGLRCKKWNVSCETYGRRWRLGDTVGALIDMDLLEVRFYLNGEDLGQAFEDFSGYDIFPALSLNVRQCVRLNFGQYKFLHPPDELDGKPFKPVLQALEEKHAAVAAAVALKAASTPNSSTKSPTKAALAAQFSAKSVSSDTIVGHDSEQSLDVAVAPVSPLTERVAAAGVASTLQLDSTTPNANPMTPIRQALLSGMGTPAGAETPSTQMITPAHTPVGPGQALAQIAESPTGAGATAGDPIAGEDAAVVAPAAPVGFSTPPRSNNAGGDTPVASAATRRELQDQDAEELTLREVKYINMEFLFPFKSSYRWQASSCQFILCQFFSFMS